MKFLLLSLIFAVFAQDLTYGQGVDLTRVPEAAGTNVVFSTVVLIQDAEIFPIDNRFLRRLAYVESRDGVAISTFREDYFGGIWQVDENLFNETLDLASNPELSVYYTRILNAFSIDWSQVEWDDLLAPLFSALAARLYLTTVTAPIPTIGDLEGQGQYWLDNYSNDPTDTVQLFIDSVNEFELLECPIQGVDLAFVFDSSSSVGRSNFNREREFAIQVTETFRVGPNDTRIANIAYSGEVRTSFLFDTFTNRSLIVEALGEVEYFNVAVPRGSNRGTNTAGALTTLRDEIFTVENGAREARFGIPRIAVVITDGRSNVNPSETIPSAQRLHEDGVSVFGVGVGNNLNLAELDAIASSPDFRVLLESFSAIEFTTLQRTISSEACIVPAFIDISEEIEGILGQEDSSFFNFQLPVAGMTLRLEAQSGRSVMYVSDKIQNPNSAFHDYRYDSEENRGGLYVSPEMLGAGIARGRRAVDGLTMSGSNFTNTTLYVTIQGLEDSNSFTIRSTFGNTSSAPRLVTGLSTVTVLLLIALACLL